MVVRASKAAQTVNTEHELRGKMANTTSTNTSKATPAIAVLMASYNDKPEILRQSLESVLASSIPLDIYLVDDGSTTPVEQTVKSFFKTVPANLHILRLPQNSSLPRALNHGLKEILANKTYTFVGRFDSDDICHKERFAKQKDFLETNRNVSLVGCWAEFIDENGQHLYYFNPPVEHKAIRNALYGNNCVLHPSWLARREVFMLEDGYNPAYPIAQDYELLTRAVTHGHKLAQLPEYLLRYRMSSTNISLSKRRKQLAARFRIQLTQFNPCNLYAWLGLFKTVALFLTPTSLVQFLKARMKAYKAQKA